MGEGVGHDVFLEVDAIECHFEEIDVLTGLVGETALDSDYSVLSFGQNAQHD